MDANFGSGDYPLFQRNFLAPQKDNPTRADLTEATLAGSGMRNAILQGAIFCSTTIPDRSINNSGCKK
ncbi:MAG: hypothetical protein NUV75_05570 [Gallionella sp.]|nr:hypothetical protein [Gallionella sp.]